MKRAAGLSPELETLVPVVRERIKHEILFELQTGGGLSLPERVARRAGSDHHQHLAAICASVAELRTFFQTAPERVAMQLLRGGMRVLDVGAGKAPWSLAFARRDQSVRIVAVDLPEQIPALRQAVLAAGREHSFTLVGVDALSPGWQTPDGFDLIIVANVCHLFNAHRNGELLRQLVPQLACGGVLAIVDQVLEEDPDWGRWSALYALGVLHEAPGGYLFPRRTYVQWLYDLGLRSLSSRSICPLPPLTLITASRPE